MCMAQQRDTLGVLQASILPLIDDRARPHPIAAESLATHFSLFVFYIDVTADSRFYLGMRRL